ncbi:MAG: hypothetical protein ACKVS9_15945 [Phycisphaerae bacterium]
MAVKPNGSIDTVFERVQAYLDQHQPDACRLRVSKDGISHDSDWWYAPVYPEQEDVRSDQYAFALAAIEESYRQEFGDNILFVPSINDD